MAVLSIISVSTTGRPNADAKINGTKFGASQGASQLLFYPDRDGVFVLVEAIASWSDTQIIVSALPDAPAGANGFFVLIVAGERNARSESFVIGTPVYAVPTDLVGQLVQAQPGTTGHIYVG